MHSARVWDITNVPKQSSETAETCILSMQHEYGPSEAPRGPRTGPNGQGDAYMTPHDRPAAPGMLGRATGRPRRATRRSRTVV